MSPDPTSDERPPGENITQRHPRGSSPNRETTKRTAPRSRGRRNERPEPTPTTPATTSEETPKGS
jgi:hypothetical protein